VRTPTRALTWGNTARWLLTLYAFFEPGVVPLWSAVSEGTRNPLRFVTGFLVVLLVARTCLLASAFAALTALAIARHLSLFRADGRGVKHGLPGFLHESA
jgi:hypothetical protein